MNRILTVWVIFCTYLVAGCGNRNEKAADNQLSANADTGTAIISFTEYEHDFGKVSEGEKISYLFSFKNTGTGNLVISSAETSCGCTVSKYDRKPIAPEADGKIEVTFDTEGRNGRQTKTVTINSNASKPVVLLKITSEVVSDEN